MTTENEMPESAAFDWKESLRAAWKRRWLIVACLILGVGVAFVLLAKKEVLYEARAVLFIDERVPGLLDNVKPLVNEQFNNADMINTMVDILGGYPFALRVTEQLNLNHDRDFLKAAGLEGENVTAEHAARVLNGMVKARYREGTRLLDITVRSKGAAESEKIANSYAQEYLNFVLDRRMVATRSANESLIQESERLRQRMRASETAMQKFREKERTASLESLQEEAQNKLTEITLRTSQLEDKEVQLKRDLAAAKAGSGSPEELLRLPSVANDLKVAALSSLIAEHERNISVLSQRYRPKHPTYMGAAAALQFSVTERNEILLDAVTMLDTTLQQTDVQLQQTRQTKSEYEAQLLKITAKAIDYNDLKRELESDSALYSSVLERLKEADVTKSFNDAPVQIHELASMPISDASSPIKTFAACTFVGLLSGLGIAIGLHFLDQSVKTIDEAEKISGLSVFSSIPLIKPLKSGEGLVTFKNREGQAAEAFRSLRAVLASRERLVECRRILLFTSPMPGEGKTFTSSNFAITLAQQGLRTLLIDADLRRPGVANLFASAKGRAGLSDVLASTVSLDDALTPTKIPKLTLLTAGYAVSDPSELLAPEKLRALLKRAADDFDRIVIDSPPCLAVSDTILLAAHADVCCLVVRAFGTSKSVLKRAVKMLDEADCPPAGIVFNGLPSNGSDSYSYYYSSLNGNGSYEKPVAAEI